MCLDHRRIIEYSFTVYPHQAIPPIHSSSPTPSHPLMCASSQCQQIHLRPRVAHTHMCRVYSSPSGAPTRNHSIFLTTRKQRIRRRHTCTGSRGVESLDTERGRARSLLRVLTRSRSFVDALECRELDYDGCGHGWRQLSGTCLTRTFEAMLKDRMIIAAEVLHKYDEKVQSYFPLLSRTTH